MFDDYIKLQAEIVNGKCPTCHEMTILVGLSKEYYRCISCGADLQQHAGDLAAGGVAGGVGHALPSICQWSGKPGSKTVTGPSPVSMRAG